MNETKARDHFSAYHLGELEPGLREAFERALASDAQTQAEYRAFAATMDSLDRLKHIEVPVPPDLHDRITARVDRHVWEQKRAQKPGLFGLWRSVALGGVAMVALVGAFLSLKSSGPLATGGVLPGPSADAITIRDVQGTVTLDYAPSSPEVVVVQSGLDGPELSRFRLDGERLNSPLENPSKEAALVTISVLGKADRTIVALPGSARNRDAKGQGTIAEMARAMAGFYRRAVQLTSGDPDARVSWEFSAGGPGKSVVEGGNVTVTEMSSGVISLQDR
ncbi:MAG: hypothetical protein KIS66_02190 [Fimbriimonadaceae bacterium]|nr:hypothetical protein [Fimbriimonadaceae bacterium]